MSNELYVIGYEGDDRSVVNFAASRAKKNNAAVHVVHVLEWSPYSFLTPEELEERHGRRKEEMARANEVVMEPILGDLKKDGIEATGDIRYGSVVDTLAEIAGERNATMIFVGRAGSSSVAARVFGSVPMGLAQVAPVPVVIVP